MDSKYHEFFDILPKHALVPLMQLVPNKFKQIDTNLLAYIFVQHGVIKKIVSDNLKEAAGKIIKQQLKTNTGDQKTIDYHDMELSEECTDLINCFLYFKNKYKETVSSEIITAYVSYVMITNTKLKCYPFFDQCLYTKEKDKVRNELRLTLDSFIGNVYSTTLSQYGEYLTDPLLPKYYNCKYRDVEIQELLDVLCRYNKCNAVLVGNPGVGKTSIVKGVCNIIQSSECPKQLRKYNVFSLNLNRIMSGTTYRGDLERRIDEILSELKKQNNIILFIDEMHILFDKDGDYSSLQNVLKPYLVEGSKVIGCTTKSEYKHIEKDKAFERRFSVINVQEMKLQDTISTIKECKHEYEKFHDVEIEDHIAEYIVNRCHDYIKNRYFPDIAFDILDKSCVQCLARKETKVSEEDVNISIFKFCNIQEKTLTINHIRKVQDEINSIVIGQPEAVKSVCNCLKKYLLGVNDKAKPIGNFLFVGPTGTGKTEVCKQFAKKVFTEESFIRFDMSEFMESHSVSKLIGSPPGYVGFYQGGSLTELVKHNPFSIILFDEIEKAHKDVINILLQIMDDGRLTDSFGSTINFCNCIIIMTSNIGCKEYLNKASLGFQSSTEKDNSILRNAITDYFSPEFLNRLNDIIYFNNISDDIFNQVFEKEMKNFINVYTENGITISIDDQVKDKILGDCYNTKNGVRFIRRYIEKTLEPFIFMELENSETVNSIRFSLCSDNSIMIERMN